MTPATYHRQFLRNPDICFLSLRYNWKILAPCVLRFSNSVLTCVDRLRSSLYWNKFPGLFTDNISGWGFDRLTIIKPVYTFINSVCIKSIAYACRHLVLTLLLYFVVETKLFMQMFVVFGQREQSSTEPSGMEKGERSTKTSVVSCVWKPDKTSCLCRWWKCAACVSLHESTHYCILFNVSLCMRRYSMAVRCWLRCLLGGAMSWISSCPYRG